MAVDLSTDAQVVMQEFSNTGVVLGVNTVQGIFNCPSKTVLSFELGVSSTDPTVTLLTGDSEANNVDSGTLLTITKNGTAYMVNGSPDSDGEGLTVCTLTEPQ